MATLFPAEFADLEAVAAPWAIPSYTERYRKRLNSSMEELEAFYTTVFPRAQEIITYCDGFDIKEPPEEVKALLNVIYSLLVASYAVEVWKQPRVPDSGATFLEGFVEPAV
jgi:hypothetical protein